MINALAVLPNPIVSTPKLDSSAKKLHTIVLCGNFLGVIRVIAIFS